MILLTLLTGSLSVAFKVDGRAEWFLAGITPEGTRQHPLPLVEFAVFLVQVGVERGQEAVGLVTEVAHQEVEGGSVVVFLVKI